jgi:LAS superfamily LD-carboxypeptidase LdcB
VSLESALARIQEIQTALVPVQPNRSYTAPAGNSSFATTLQDAMAPGSAGGTASPTSVQAAPGQYPHLDGDLDAKPELLQRLEALAEKRGEHFHITSGLRTIAEQQRLWDNRASNPFPVARPGTSRHQSGNAADVTIGGRPIQSVISAAELRAAGLAPLAGDAVHVELPS